MTIGRTLATVALLACASVAFADTMLVKKVHQDAIEAMNQPAKDATQTVWLAPGKMRVDGGDSGFLVRLDQKKAYMLDGKSKKAFAIDLPVDVTKLVPAEQQAMIEQLKAMQMKITVTPSAETKKFGALTARRYDVLMENQMGMKNEQTIWASKDVKIESAQLHELTAPLVGLNPTMAQLVDEMKKVEGLTLASETVVHMMATSFKVTEEFVSLDEKPAPAGTYDVPAGFAVEPFNLLALQGR